MDDLEEIKERIRYVVDGAPEQRRLLVIASLSGFLWELSREKTADVA